MKFVFTTLIILISLKSFAQTSDNPLENVITMGQATLSAKLQVLEDDRRIVTYSTAQIDSNFYLYDDQVFQMGYGSKCGANIGKTVKELAIPLTIQKRFKNLGWNKGEEAIGKTGKATLIIPKGTRVFGDCSGQSLYSLSIQTNKTFKIVYPK